MRSHNPVREELYPVIGDDPNVPDPMGSGKLGIGGTMMERTPICRPLVRYRDIVLQLDVYPLPGLETGGRPAYEVILLCPRCSTQEHKHGLRITSDRKQMELDMERGDGDGALISIEPFQCTWEMGPERGSGLCRWKVGIDKNVAFDA